MAVAAAAWAAGATIGGVAVIVGTTVATYVAVGYATSLVLRSLMPRPQMPSFGGGNKKNRGYNITQTGSALDHQIVYGKMRTGAVRVFDGTTGSDNKELHRVLAFTGHEIESFDQIYINDDIATVASDGDVTSPSRYSGKINIKKHLGAADQVADSTLVSNVSAWTNNHRLRGIAYLYCKFTYDADTFPNGVPEITAVIKGKKVYDPNNSSAAPAWSDNPALCIRDYLTSTGYGLGELSANIDDTLFSTAATVCDETGTDAGTTRYTMNGAFTTAATPVDFLQDAITSMGATLWYNQGSWKVKAAKFVAASVNFDEDDLRSGISLATRNSRRDNFNTVRGTFRGEESNYQVTDFPPVTNSTLATALVTGASYTITSLDDGDGGATTDFTLVGATSNTVGLFFTADLSGGAATGTGKVNAFVGADGGQEASIDFDLSFTDNSIEARRISRIVLERNRQQLTVEASFGLRALQVQTGDTITLTNTRLGWSSKEFEVMSWSFGSVDEYDLQVDMVLREISASVFDEVDDGIVYERDNTTLLSAFEVPTLSMVVGSDLRRVKGKTTGVMTIDVTNTSNIMDVTEVEYRKVGDTNFIGVGRLGSFIGTSRIEVMPIVDGRYDIRVRAINSLGVHGDYTTLSNELIEPLGAPPADVTNFTGNLVGPNLYLTWTPVPDLDLAHYIIKYSKATTGALYNSSTAIAEVPSSLSVFAVADAGPGTYFIKAVDDTASGANTSVNPAKFVITGVGMEELNVVATITEHPTFGGVKDTVEIVNGKLMLTSELFDNATGDFDDRDDTHALFDLVDSFEPTGIYYFANNFDIGFKSTSRLGYDVRSNRFNNADTFDFQPNNFNDPTVLFDETGADAEDVSVVLQLRHTDDDPNGTPTYTDWQDFSISDITARAFQFRALLTSTDPSSSPQIEQLTVNIDMPDRVEAGSDITFTGTKNVLFTNPFADVPALGISLADAVEGDRYTITNKTRTGFSFNMFTGSAVSTNAVTLDYVAKGYGKETT